MSATPKSVSLIFQEKIWVHTGGLENWDRCFKPIRLTLWQKLTSFANLPEVYRSFLDRTLMCRHKVPGRADNRVSWDFHLPHLPSIIVKHQPSGEKICTYFVGANLKSVTNPFNFSLLKRIFSAHLLRKLALARPNNTCKALLRNSWLVFVFPSAS